MTDEIPVIGEFEALLKIVQSQEYPSKAHVDLLQAIITSNGNVAEACKKLGKNERNQRRLLKHIRDKASTENGYDPRAGLDNFTNMRELSIHGRSSLVKTQAEEGVILQWVKESKDKAQQSENIKQYIEGLCEQLTPRQPRKFKRTKQHTDDLMTGIFIGDAHIGMYAYNKETKHSDFDSDIATEQLRDAIDYLVDKAEPTETGLLIDVGDYLHTNGQQNTTFSGTPQDVDTRQDSVQRKAAMCMVYMIDRMLDKFKKVIVVIAKGNHDTDSSSVIRIGVSLAYRNEKRVKVLDSDGFYNYIEYGKWLLGIHHGDKQKPEALAGSMARDMPQAWGRTTHRMWCVGHFHKDNVKTLPGVKYKVFAALPPPDSWHASKGYMGDGEMEMLTFRKEGGLYSSHVYSIPQVMHEPDARVG